MPALQREDGLPAINPSRSFSMQFPIRTYMGSPQKPNTSARGSHIKSVPVQAEIKLWFSWRSWRDKSKEHWAHRRVLWPRVTATLSPSKQLWHPQRAKHKEPPVLKNKKSEIKTPCPSEENMRKWKPLPFVRKREKWTPPKCSECPFQVLLLNHWLTLEDLICKTWNNLEVELWQTTLVKTHPHHTLNLICHIKGCSYTDAVQACLTRQNWTETLCLQPGHSSTFTPSFVFAKLLRPMKFSLRLFLLTLQLQLYLGAAYLLFLRWQTFRGGKQLGQKVNHLPNMFWEKT